MSSYGKATCKTPITLEVWGSVPAEVISLVKGDVLDITYHEFDGTLGLTKDGEEYICSRSDRDHFDEEWSNE